MVEKTQWHKTEVVNENGVLRFVKFFEPNGFEIKNEIKWLTHELLQTTANFRLPEVVEHSVTDGFIKMENVEISDNLNEDDLVKFLIQSAAELHSILKTEEPENRKGITASAYKSFIDGILIKRIEELRTEFELDEAVCVWAMGLIQKLEYDFFSIVHKDFRCRHLLVSDNKTPTLIDWEFSEVGEPIQDLAKLIYDCVITMKMDYSSIFKKVTSGYAQLLNVPQSEIEARVIAFLPLIALEHSARILKKKHEGYKEIILRDLYFIEMMYRSHKS